MDINFRNYIYIYVFFFKQKTAYEMRISDWSSDVCSSDLLAAPAGAGAGGRSHAGSHHRRREPYHVIRRTRPALTLGASAPFLLRPAAQLRPSRACACYALAENQVWWCRVGGGLAVSLHTIGRAHV